MTGQTAPTGPLTAETIENALVAYLTERTKTEVGPDDDIFASGLVSSMFAMELVVHIESTYDLTIIGPELKIDNFRTARGMAALVLRLAEENVAADA